MKLTLLLTLVGGALAAASADELATWEWLSPKPAGTFLTKIVFDGHQFVGVGDMGVILTSTNGFDWNLAYTDTTNRLFGIISGGGWLVGYGDRGTILASTDAFVWTNAGTGTMSSIWAMAHGLDRFVSLDFENRLFVSTREPLHWQESLNAPTNAALDLAFGNELFVAVGWRGMIVTSTNAFDWVYRESGTQGPIQSVAYGDGRWVAVGGEGTTGIILTSVDAIIWFLQITDQPLYDVTYGPFGFIVTGGGFMQPGVSMTSSDGVYFSGGEPGASGLDELAQGVACGNGVCVAVGGNGRIWMTDDGTNWVSQTSGHDLHVTALAVSDSTIVGVGLKGAIASSVDGYSFTGHNYSTNEHLVDVIYTGSRFVAVGSFGVVRTSADGQDWQLEDTGTNAMFKAVAHGNDRTVAIGWNAVGKPYGLFAVREDTGQWQVIRPAENEYLNTSISHGNGRFVAAGYNGVLWLSSDGLTWLRHDLGTGRTILPIQFINGHFMGSTGTEMGFSSNGSDWSFVPGNPPSMKEIAYGNGLYVAAGPTWGGIQISANAIDWTFRPMKTLDLTSVTYFKDAFYVSGFILKSRSSLISEIQSFSRSGGGWNFDLFGRIGRDYELQSSTNLTDWAFEQDYTQSARQHPLTLPTGPDQRFYRVKLKE